MKLSIVMCGSNEGYGGDFLGRMQNCVNSILEGATRWNLDGELVLVEWGPPADRPSLADAINWSKATIPVRIIRVPKSLIATIPNPRQVRFFEPWAKNVGIRRACGEYILTTNADSIYSDDMMHFLAQGTLDAKHFYRANRHDTRQGKVYNVCRANGSFRPNEPFEGVSKTPVPYSQNMLHFHAAGEFIMMSRENYLAIGGWPEVDFWVTVDGKVVQLAHEHGLKQVVLPHRILHQDHGRPSYDSPGMSYPPCDDAHPNAVKNSKPDWGFVNENFETVEIGTSKLFVKPQPRNESAFNVDTCKIVIWGHKHIYHTQKHIHEAFARALPMTGRTVAWIDGEEDAKGFDFSNTLFIGEHQSLKGLPRRGDCFYVIHCLDKRNQLAYFEDLQVMLWRPYCANEGAELQGTDVDLNVPFYLGEGANFFPGNPPLMEMMWATDLLPNEIKTLKPDRVFRSNSKVVNWVGSFNSSVEPFVRACEKNNIAFKVLGGYHPEKISIEENVRLIQESYLAPALAAPHQLVAGYIPCRVFKNISYGQFGVTNSDAANSLFGDTLIYSHDGGRLFDMARQRLATTRLSELHNLMDVVAEKHTYLNRIQTILQAVRLALETR